MTVSVIIPVYKVEAFVERAVRSILAQTLTDMEVLCVDDGSPDRSGAILDKLAEEDARVRVIHQKNAGAPAARNRAIELAQGKYLYRETLCARRWAWRTRCLRKNARSARRPTAFLIKICSIRRGISSSAAII